MKLFGSKRSGARLAKNRPQYDGTPTSVSSAPSASVVVETEQPRKQRKPLKKLVIFLSVILALEGLYFFGIYTSFSPIANLRTRYIQTGMETLSHKWLVNLIIPYEVIAQVNDARADAQDAQQGLESQWGPAEEPAPEEPLPEAVTPADKPEDEEENNNVDITVTEKEDPEKVAKDTFYELFHEVDKSTMDAYLAAHPEALANGWANLIINEAGLDDKGTEIMTVHGDQVLALDVPNQILIVRVSGSGWMGALAIAKDPARLSLRPASTIWKVGEPVGTIAKANNGVLGMTGSAFHDPDGGGNGGEISGFAMYNGRGDGYGHMQEPGRKRIELHEDNLFYIKDANSPTGEGTTDAVEFGPALVVDGQVVVDANCGYTGIQPRAVIGQSDKYEIMMLVIEGRLAERSLGTDVIVCANLLQKYGCMQAMNLDGGTSAMLWYDGEEITKCSNRATPAGRNMPTAWVYERLPATPEA